MPTSRYLHKEKESQGMTRILTQTVSARSDNFVPTQHPTSASRYPLPVVFVYQDLSISAHM
jgi:hypothetical protein